MSGLGGIEFIGDSGAAFIHQDFARTFKDGFYTDSEQLAVEVNDRIQQRTAIRTGALLESETYIINHDPSNEDLVAWFPLNEPQLAEWNRVYVAYQEGGELGMPTYTNEPRLMYASVETEDLPLIEAWGYGVLEKRAGVLAQGAGFKI